MDLGYLIQLLDNKLTSLILAKDQAFMGGDLERITVIDAEILGVQDTLSKLKFALEFSNAAAAANTTPAEIMVSGIEAIKNSTTEVPTSDSNSVAPLNKYNLSTYAVDPLYLQKITDILSLLGSMSSVSEINIYIDSETIGSPLTGEMIMSAAQQYSIDVRLLISMLELESRFGTAGVAVSTLNPGNVGNTGTATRIYGSWQEGVNAVAEWLNRHRIANPVQTPVQDLAQVLIAQPALASISVVPTIIDLVVGETQRFNVSTLDQNGAAIATSLITFTSNNNAVATVDKDGILTAISSGTAVITVRATLNNKTVISNSTITVNNPIIVSVLASIIITPNVRNALVGDTQQFAANPLDQNGNPITGSVITFKSDDKSIATVDENGMAMAVSAGTATITAKATLNGNTVTGNSIIVVNNPVVLPVLTNITIAPASTDIITGSTQQLTANPLDHNGAPFTDALITFSSDNTAVATVDNNTGMVTTISAGIATITVQATSNNNTVTANSVITVNNPETPLIPTEPINMPSTTLEINPQDVNSTSTPISADIKVRGKKYSLSHRVKKTRTV